MKNETLPGDWPDAPVPIAEVSAALAALKAAAALWKERHGTTLTVADAPKALAEVAALAERFVVNDER